MMKNFLLIALICLAFGCKKKDIVTGNDITKYNWPLSSATVKPAMVANGMATTNYMTMPGNSTCLNHNYTLSFYDDGFFSVSSNGPLCDMFASSKATWVINGNDIKLNNGMGNESVVKLNGNTITGIDTFEQNGVTYTVTYIYKAKSK
ncbi:lipocalin family protein [Pedobacter punctiformis]|uniref:Lipocalin-like domain-containing protein n=1 Tax=Pedobacter punctiformis TaxID=3004097 RepID=A0ABT4L609_9SPHI|nr:lipocalin family protein [Pedobacter sp. HCMS5-2]MCZ4243351.1 hypothetical protein [Pedobacter sp. HCMS5-2]